MRLVPPAIGGFPPLDTSLIVESSGYCFILTSSFYLFRSALSHLVTSKDAFAFCNLSNCFTFSIISSLSLRRFRSLLRLEMERLCGLDFNADDFEVLNWPYGLPAVLPRAESVAERDECALFYRGRLLLLRLFIRSVCDPVLNALPIRSLGASYA